MPEATIHEHSDPLATKYEVRFSKHRLASAPAANVGNFEELNHAQLGITIPTTSNTRHYFWSLLWHEYVCHCPLLKRNKLRRIARNSQVSESWEVYLVVYTFHSSRQSIGKCRSSYPREISFNSE